MKNEERHVQRGNRTCRLIKVDSTYITAVAIVFQQHPLSFTLHSIPIPFWSAKQQDDSWEASFRWSHQIRVLSTASEATLLQFPIFRLIPSCNESKIAYESVRRVTASLLRCLNTDVFLDYWQRHFFWRSDFRCCSFESRFDSSLRDL